MIRYRLGNLGRNVISDAVILSLYTIEQQIIAGYLITDDVHFDHLIHMIPTKFLC